MKSMSLKIICLISVMLISSCNIKHLQNDFDSRWFINSLGRMNEPIRIKKTKTKNSIIYRFTYIEGGALDVPNVICFYFYCNDIVTNNENIILKIVQFKGKKKEIELPSIKSQQIFHEIAKILYYDEIFSLPAYREENASFITDVETHPSMIYFENATFNYYRFIIRGDDRGAPFVFIKKLLELTKSELNESP